MSRGGVLRWTARRLPGVERRIHEDLIVSVDELAGRGSRADRVLEVGSLVGFALRSTSRRGARDDRGEMVRQGLHVGGLVLAVAGALLAWTNADDLRSLALAGIASLVAATIAGGLRAAVVLAAANVVVSTLAGGPAALPLLVLGAVAAGHRFDARPCPAGATVAAAGVTAGGVVAALLPSAPTATGLTVATAVVPVALLAIGWFDPRYAVAGTVVWLWRFVAVDLDELARAVQALGDDFALRLLLARWLLMGLGVVLAWQVANAAIRRCLTVFR